MPRHSDGVGYLIDIRDQENTPFFSKICDLALSSSSSALNETQLETLCKIFTGEEKYTPSSATPVTTSTTTTSTTTTVTSIPITNHFIHLSNFQNFKRLSDNLKVDLNKRVTIIFGCTGSGKSSLCEAIKLLACPDKPMNPLNNVKSRTSAPSSFSYQFGGDTASSTWSITQGYGMYADRIKYFDSTIAVKNTTEAVQLDSMVTIEPFRLEIFTFAGDFTRKLNDRLLRMIRTQIENINNKIDVIKARFNDLVYDQEKAISNLTESDYKDLETLIAKHIPIQEGEANTDNISSLDKMEQARSEAGLRLQRTELRQLRGYGHSIKDFIKSINAVSFNDVIELASQLFKQQEIQQELVKKITPNGILADDFEKFLRSTEKIFNYDDAENELCSFCRRPIDEQSLDIIKRYHEFLLDKLGKDIRDNKTKLDNDVRLLNRVRDFSLAEYDTTTFPLNEDILKKVEEYIEQNKSPIPIKIEDLSTAKPENYGNLEALKESIKLIAGEVLKRYRAIRLSTASEEEYEKERKKLKDKIRQFKYRKGIDDNLEELKEIIRLIKDKNILKNKIDDTSFTALLRKITIKSKEAHRELVVKEFEKSLNDEYKNISGCTMADYGIELASAGSEQTVTVETNIGNEPINRVLSEGEQKIHALALFFGEASVGNHKIMVFDDPVTSFDYNYSARYAERLRDYILGHPDVQVIVLTHNWDFFVNMQSILNQSNLNSQTSIRVLEECTIVDEYSEKTHELKSEIQNILGCTGEPSRADKERLAVTMRRLIEAVVNKHVFNGERHQFKQKSVVGSVFGNFTKIVPLLDTEAQKFRDLYRNLSVPEHEDPRNYYVVISKALFQSWFDDICNIEAAIIGRRP